MKLELLLESAKYADEQVLRYYSKLTKKWEDKGHGRYSLSGICDLIYFSSFIGPLKIYYNPKSLLENIFVLITPVSLGISGGLSYWGYFFGEPNEINSTSKALTTNDYDIHRFKKFGKAIRTPELIAGISFAGKGIYDIYNYLSNHEGSLSEGINNLMIGTSFVSNASAWYIRDSDPKLLDKAPFWKTTYDFVKEKVKSLAPSPQPIPQPSPTFSMENYLSAN